MKKILLTAAAATMLIVACSKDDNPTPPPPDPSTEIRGDWAGVSYVMTGFIDGEAIDETNTDKDALVKSLKITLFEGTETADSIKGTYGEENKALLGTYVLNTEKDKTSIDAKLDLGEAEDFNVKGDVSLTKDSLIVTSGVKGDVQFGDKTADSTSTVVKFVREK
ncbi:hypothetical protein [Arachidicoccus terrestris]|uniref:hypothetical protein n=1 Tax=Arachidicoccus terrestris TaxID=2875539 RepID=UPI001CC627C9|nr:hypothetical protein [Arachidicoccus terrestris]UAY56572.1 hypothetical protein K9M52_06090 [Arachidicoccus terrestris]